jgi:hypothetical protein
VVGSRYTLETQRLFQVKRCRIDAVAREGRLRDDQCLRLFQARTGAALVLILVIAVHARRARIDFDKVLILHLRREAADHPRRRRNLRPHHFDERIHRHVIPQEIFDGQSVEAARPAAVFARRVAIPGAEAFDRCGDDAHRRGGRRSFTGGNALGLFFRDAIVDNVIHRRCF